MRARLFFKQLFLLSLIVTFSPFYGCLPRPEESPPPPPAEETPPQTKDVEHTVRYSGETLAVISKWYTGKTDNWRAIKNANPGLKPERMSLGQKILIPGDLVIQEEPMPQKTVRSWSEAAKQKQATAPVAEQREEPAAKIEGDRPETDIRVEQPAAVPAAIMKEPPQETVEPESTKPVKASAPAAPAKASSEDEKERERLLDELLSQ